MTKDDDEIAEAGQPLPDSGTPIVPPDLALTLERHAPTLASVYGLAELERDRERAVVSLATLPAWPDDASGARSVFGHGWGEHLDHLLGGIAPGETVAIGASSAGAGKTAFLMQIADGLALRCALEQGPREPLTPVLVLSEMGVAPLTWRSLARWTGYSARIFRAGRSSASIAPGERADADAAWSAARVALEREAFGRSRAFVRVLRVPSLAIGGPAVLEEAAGLVEQWRSELAAMHRGRDVVPVVVVDPIQRYQGGNRSEVEALNSTVEALGRIAEDRGWIGLVTSDTNKASASGKEESEDERARGASALRGSYKLQHLPSAVLFLERTGDENADGFAELRVVVVKNRWGSARAPWPRFRWHLRSGRMLPRKQVETLELEKLEAAKQDTKGKRAKGQDDAEFEFHRR